ncbi:MAG: hypothetical protein QF561_05455 [Phycisphaerales bacterium]|jgi:hypothetical protein|nr:hypothetical protein [Phycisphaerales bacterium]
MIASWCLGVVLMAAAPTGGQQRLMASMEQLDNLVSAQWQEGMHIDLTLLGLDEAARREAAVATLDEAILLTERLRGDLSDEAARGGQTSLYVPRWRLHRGIVCAAIALMNPEREDLAAEASQLLQEVPRRLDSGRGRRLLAMLRGRVGDGAEARHWAESAPDDSRVPIYEQWVAAAMRLHFCQAAQRGGLGRQLLETADAAWQVILIGEAAMASEAAARRAVSWAPAIRSALGRCGINPSDHLELVAAMVARLPALGSPTGEPGDAAVGLGAARAALAAGRLTDAESWIGDPATAPASDRSALFAELARCAEARGEALAAMRAWKEAASAAATGGADALDQAARHAAQLINAVEVEDEAMAVLKEAAVRGSSRGIWMMAIARIEAARGDTGPAIARLMDMPPKGPDHLRALAQAADLIRSRRADTGQWDHADSALLARLLAAAAAAAAQQGDPLRAANAEPVVGRIAAVDVERLIDLGHLDEAAARLDDPGAGGWMRAADRRLLRARLAVAGRDEATLAALVGGGRAAGDARFCEDLLRWAASSFGSEQALHLVVSVIEQPLVASGGDHPMEVAEALRAAGRCDWALPFYEAALIRAPDRLAAVLGRSECLRFSEDRAELAAAAEGYRRVAALPRADDPVRWRLANTRLLGVLQRAGVEPTRLEARLARLRLIDPEVALGP